MKLAPRLLAPVLLVAGLAPRVATADITKAQCIEANTKAQDLRRDGKLHDARAALTLCSDPKCPGIVRTDCTKRLDELDGAQPTIVFGAKDGTGKDLSDVTVTIDAQPLATRLDGTAIQIDPGEHVFTFTVPNESPVTEKLVIREAEKGRREAVIIGSPPPPPSPPPTGPLPPAQPPPSGWGMQKTLGLVAGSVGVAGIAVGSVFGLFTISAVNAQKSDCQSSTNCPHYSQATSEHSTWTTDGTVSTAAFIAGSVLLAGGAVLFFTAHPSSEQSPTATSLIVAPTVGPGAAGMLFEGRF